jgi:hypothetical protein
MIAVIVGRVAVDAGSADSERHGVNAPGGNSFQGATEAKEPFSGESPL